MRYVIFKLFAKMPQHALHRHCGSIPSAQIVRPAILVVMSSSSAKSSASPSCLYAVNHTIKPASALPAGSTLAAGLFIIEIGHSLQHFNHAVAFIQHNDCPEPSMEPALAMAS